MKITVEYNQVHNCLVGKFIGTIEAKHVREYAEEVLKLVRIHDCKRFLNDMREAEIKMSIADLYYVSAEAAVEEFDRSWKRKNKGLNLKTFDNFDEALVWLV